MKKPPIIENAPGLTWRPRKVGWEARWQARTDLVSKGFLPKSARLWAGADEALSPVAIQFIQDRCDALQREMITWARGGIPQDGIFDGSLVGLSMAYQTDKDSKFAKPGGLRYKTRVYYTTLLQYLEERHGNELIADIKARQVLRWHEEWSEGGKIAMGHALMGMFRTIVNFGATILENKECERLAFVLHKMRFPMAKARTERITAEQADLLRAQAHKEGMPSVALAQAIQFELLLRQRDVIGEWVPIPEPGVTEITSGNSKWLRGIRWEEIDANLVLTHVTSKRQKEISVDLTAAPMVCEELDRAYPGWRHSRSALPAVGPIIVRETTTIPWFDTEYRRVWRKLARACGIPDAVKNMDSRAGGISEATDAGAELEHVRHAATHGDISMTSRYSRSTAEKIANVQLKRAEYRNKKGTT